MGFWFFLTVVVAGNMAFRAYKFRMSLRELKFEREFKVLREELAAREKRVELLEEAVFFGDFELKRKFSKLESDFHEQQKSR